MLNPSACAQPSTSGPTMTPRTMRTTVAGTRPREVRAKSGARTAQAAMTKSETAGPLSVVAEARTLDPMGCSVSGPR